LVKRDIDSETEQLVIFKENTFTKFIEKK